MNNSIKQITIMVLISIVLIISGFIVFSKVRYINELNDVINKTNYGGKVVINADYSFYNYSYVYYFKDLSYNSSKLTKNKPVRLIKYKINSNSRLSIEKTEYWTYKKFFLLAKELDKLPRYRSNKNCDDCIKIIDYKNTYYAESNDIKLILAKYINS